MDGLTPQVLQTSPRTWWDEAFTRRLLDFIPLQTRRIVEVDCGMATAAHVLLPSLPVATYIGVDHDAARQVEAEREIMATRLKGRVELRLASAVDLPLEEASCDLVLCVMSLQRRVDVEAVLAEARRVLEPGGRIVAVEPDNLGQHFYFDGVLEEITALFHQLCLKARVARQPADIALGPRLPLLMREAGFQRTRMAVHMVQSVRSEPAKSFFDRLERIATAIAGEAGLAPDSELVAACEQAIRRCLFAGLPKRVGTSCHFVPVFICAAKRIS